MTMEMWQIKTYSAEKNCLAPYGFPLFYLFPPLNISDNIFFKSDKYNLDKHKQWV